MIDLIKLALYAILFAVVSSILIGLILGIPLMWLWNALMPALFGLPTVTFWQAVGPYLLCSLLFNQSHGSSSSKR